MADVIRINENTWRFEDGHVRFFLLTGSEKALMIDSGMTCPNALELAKELTSLPIELLNTHADPDHISGIQAWDQFYMNEKEKQNYGMRNVKGEILPIKTGTLLDLGDRPLTVIELPGHTPGSVAVLDQKNRVLFSGDAIQDSNIFMFGPGRNLQQYLDSFANLDPYKDQFDTIYPSHGSIPVKPELIPHLIQAGQTILKGEAQGIPMEMFGQRVLLYKFDCAGFFCDAKE